MAKKTMNIEFILREIVYENGKTELLCMTNQQYAGFIRRKGLRKKIITNKKLFAFKLSTKNFLS